LRTSTLGRSGSSPASVATTLAASCNAAHLRLATLAAPWPKAARADLPGVIDGGTAFMRGS
jgi:hypothetical protein